MAWAISNADVRFAKGCAANFCRRYNLRSSHGEEVFSDMLVGMNESAGRFDAAREVSFPAFARKRMFGAAIDGLIERGGIPRRQWARGRRRVDLTDEVRALWQFAESVEPSEIERLLAPLLSISHLLVEAVQMVVLEDVSIRDASSRIGITTKILRGMVDRGLLYLRFRLERNPMLPKENVMSLPATKPPVGPESSAVLNEITARLLTTETLERLVEKQIELAMAGDRNAIKFVMDHCESGQNTAAKITPARSRAASFRRNGPSRGRQAQN